MLYWVLYDITDNRIRMRVAEKCKDYGLSRVQKSSFLGRISGNKAEMLALELQELVKGTEHCIFLLPHCKECFSGRIILGFLDEESIREKSFVIVGDNHAAQPT